MLNNLFTQKKVKTTNTVTIFDEWRVQKNNLLEIEIFCNISFCRLKGLLHPKVKILPLITYPMSFQTRKNFVRLRNILDENPVCDCPIAGVQTCHFSAKLAVLTLK